MSSQNLNKATPFSTGNHFTKNAPMSKLLFLQFKTLMVFRGRLVFNPKISDIIGPGPGNPQYLY